MKLFEFHQCDCFGTELYFDFLCFEKLTAATVHLGWATYGSSFLLGISSSPENLLCFYFCMGKASIQLSLFTPAITRWTYIPVNPSDSVDG